MTHWTTRNGERIPISKLADGHLANIIRYIDRQSVEGMTIERGGGDDPDSFWYEREIITGEDVYARYPYQELMQERRKRQGEKQ